MTCKLEYCSEPDRHQDLCQGHYKQLRRGQELRPLRTRGVDAAPAHAAIRAAYARGMTTEDIANKVGMTPDALKKTLQKASVTALIEDRILTRLMAFSSGRGHYMPNPEAHRETIDTFRGDAPICVSHPEVWTSDSVDDLIYAAKLCLRTNCPALLTCRAAGKREWGAYGGVVYGPKRSELEVAS